MWENLKKSFPEKTDKEIKSIQKQFFKNFADYIVETLKSITISETELKVRVQHINQKIFHEAHQENKNVIMLTGHIFNWEWINALATIIPQKNCYPVYKKINSPFWEKQVLKYETDLEINP